MSETALPKICSFPQSPWTSLRATVHRPGSWLLYQAEATSVLIHPVQMPEAGDSPGPPWGVFEGVALLRILVICSAVDQDLQVALRSIPTNYPAVTDRHSWGLQTSSKGCLLSTPSHYPSLPLVQAPSAEGTMVQWAAPKRDSREGKHELEKTDRQSSQQQLVREAGFSPLICFRRLCGMRSLGEKYHDLHDKGQRRELRQINSAWGDKAHI